MGLIRHPTLARARDGIPSHIVSYMKNIIPSAILVVFDSFGHTLISIIRVSYVYIWRHLVYPLLLV
jgi:hypothetical protein